MKNTLILLTLFVLSFCSFTKAQWSEIYSDSSYDFISDVKFINNDTGFACGVWYNNSSGIIFKTTNGGLTWDTTTSGIRFWMMSLSIVNKDIIYAGGQDGNVYKTVDGGQTWNWRWDIGGFDDLSTIYFLNSDTGYVVKFSNSLWKTTDSYSWNWQALGGHSYFPNTSSVQFLNDSVGFIAKEKVFRTQDYGATWQNLNVDTLMKASCIFMKNANEGIVVGLKGSFSRTTDGGNTFSSPQLLGTYPLYDCAFVNDSVGYIVGGNNSFQWIPPWDHDNGIIYKTINGGISWDSTQTFNHAIISLDFVNDSIGYAVGQGGKIYKITNANWVGINEPVLSGSKGVTLFPNPFEESATLYVSNGGNKLLIYNSIGMLVREEIINGQTTVIKRNQLASGIYIYQVVDQSGQYTTGKFVIE